MGKQYSIQSNKSKTKNESLFSPIDFLIKSIFFALVLTLPPIISLFVIWGIGFVSPLVMISWVMLTLFWTFYIILKVPETII